MDLGAQTICPCISGGISTGAAVAEYEDVPGVGLEGAV
jgi:hypothetical protein